MARQPAAARGIMAVGNVYLVIVSLIVLTRLAGVAVVRIGMRLALWAKLGVMAVGLLARRHVARGSLEGITLVCVDAFFVQAVATGFANRAGTDHAPTSSG